MMDGVSMLRLLSLLLVSAVFLAGSVWLLMHALRFYNRHDLRRLGLMQPVRKTSRPPPR